MRRLLGAGFASLILLAACNDVNDFDERALGPDGILTRGAADFTRYVAIGDSYAAGVTNGALACSGQIFAYPNLIARQVGLEVPESCSPPSQLPSDFSAFQQPLVTDPGVGTPLALTNPGPPPVITPVPATGRPTNGELNRPYNNLGVPGADVREINVAINQATSLDGNSAFNVVLRGIGTAPDQAKTLDATFVTFWLGSTDALSAVLSGGTTPVTDAAVFEAEYDRALDALLEVTPQIVIANVGDVAFLPFATTVPPVVVNPATGQPVIIGGSPIPLIGPNGPLTLGQDFVLLTAVSFLVQGIGIPALLGGTGTPLPDQVVLEADEVATIRAAIAAYNQTIQSAATAHDLPMLDINALGQAAIAANGLVEANGQTLSTRFLGGGQAAPFFGLDGFHPTPKGYGHLANLFIEQINSRFADPGGDEPGDRIELVDVSTLPTLIGPPGADVGRAPELVTSGNPFVPALWPERVDTSQW
jgi:lysophospholipase L1-like esterase